jgi:hypothetical protein
MIEYCLSLYGDVGKCCMGGDRREDKNVAVAAGINFIVADARRGKLAIA